MAPITLSVSRAGIGANLVRGLFLYNQLAKTGFCMFKELFEREKVYVTDHMWPTKLKIFNISPQTEKALTTLFSGYQFQTGKWKGTSWKWATQ